MGLKEKTLLGMFWSFIERFGYLSIQFLTNIILARLLSPDDFGIIGMLLVFIALSTVIIDGGFGAALIQKKELDENDSSTIFFINITVAFLLYILLFIASGNIADFYHQPKLFVLLRVIGICLIFDSLCVVQHSLYVRVLDFKKIAKVKIIAAFISCMVAITMAYTGLGVWSLVIQYVVNSLIRLILFWIHSIWYPTWNFSMQAFYSLFRFGSKLMLASVISEVYRNLQSLIIGHRFSSHDLGYFTQAKQLEQIPAMTLVSVINQVTFPVFSAMQDDAEKFLTTARKIFRVLILMNAFIMIGLTITAKPLFTFLFTEKWNEAIPYFQLLCLGFGLLLVIHNMNLNLLKAKGRSDLLLYLEITKKILGVTLIFCMLNFGVKGILYALAINSILEFFMNGYFTGKIIGYTIRLQFMDLIPALLIASVAGSITYYLFSFLSFPSLLHLILAGGLFTLLYFGIASLFHLDAINDGVEILKSKIQYNRK